MESQVDNVPQPLNGDEIRRGIAVRMASGLPEEYVEPINQAVDMGLRNTCSLVPGLAYSKFHADWSLTYWKDGDTVRANWWVDGKLDDFGRITPLCIGFRKYDQPDGAVSIIGHIGEVPPDRFRRETDQPIPKPIEMKKHEESTQTFSRSERGKGHRRDV